MSPASVAIVGTNQVGRDFRPQTTTTASTGQSRGLPMPLNGQKPRREGQRPRQRKHAPPPSRPGTWQQHHFALGAAVPTSTHSRLTPLASQPPITRCQKPAPRPPEAAPPRRHPQPQLTATTMASIIHATRQADDESSPCIPGAAAPASSSPAAPDHAGAGETCRPPLPVVRSWEHHPTVPNVATTSQGRRPGFLERGRPAGPRSLRRPEAAAPSSRQPPRHPQPPPTTTGPPEQKVASLTTRR
jgi:hypothetical protein